MITTSIIDSTKIEDGIREVKVIQFGAKTATEVSPFGFDSNTIKGLTAIYSETSENGENIIIGYINENQKSEPGESRMFCTDLDGNEISQVKCDKNGNILLGLNADDNIVKFEKLKTSLENTINLLNSELKKIQSSIGSLGGVYVQQDVGLNINSAKADKIKC